jgi:tight adherence protein C
MPMILLLSVLMFGVAVYLAGQIATQPARQREAVIRRAAGYGRARVAPGAAVERISFRERVVAPAVKHLASFALRLSPKASLDGITTRLLAAGLASRFTSTQFLALKSGLGVAGVVLSLLFSVVSVPLAAFLLVPTAGVLGFLAPEALVTMAVRSRRERIRAELPDALDLLAVSVEAGLGFDGAITKLTEHMDGALVDEFALALGEIRIGESRHEALRGMAERVPAPEVAAFVRAVIQADQLGISLGRILRVQAADSRLKRQAAAEERAMKAPIKMLFPTVMFIFPAMFIVILGPAFLNLVKHLS